MIKWRTSPGNVTVADHVTSFVINAYNLSVSSSFAPLATIPGDDSIYLPDTQSISSFHALTVDQ